LRVVIDTNVIVSALIAPSSLPARILQSWRQGRFEMLTCDEHHKELRVVTRYPKIRSRTSPSVTGNLINEIHRAGRHITGLPRIERSPDQWDNYLLALAEKGEANFLISGDKSDILSLQSHGKTRIVTARWFVDELRI